ncbi:Oxidoreductase domain protein [Candidatus Sulfopaludibacter sp. SbA6]|nr:Oxidoreductase domain protein [Candidatus Sulfopaludibacter sp. SbA6]
MDSQRPVRVAILGLGFMGSTHAKVLREIRGAELAAVCDSRDGDLTAVSGNLGGPGEKLDFSDVTRYRQLDPVLADPRIDALDICLPTDLHEPVAIEGLRAGKHVLVEKPMGLDGFAVDHMLGAAIRYKRVLMTAHVLRFSPPYIALRQAIQREGLGRLRFAMFRRRCAAPGWSAWMLDPRKSGGGVFDLLIHDADMCLHLFGKPEAVAATGYCDPDAGIDCIDAHLFYPHGGIVSITGGWHHPGAYPFSMEYTVTLDGATIDYSSSCRAPTLYAPGRPAEILDGETRDGYAAEIECFIESCRTGRPPEICPPRESADAVKLMLLLVEARTRNGRKILCSI